MGESNDGPARRLFERPRVVVAAALIASAAITLWRMSSGDADDAMDLLYVVPIALLALELGLYGGIGAAAFALALVGIWSGVHGVELGPLGFLTRAVAFAAVGAIAGRFAERMRSVHLLQHGLLQSGLTLGWVDLDHPPLFELAEAARRLTGARGVRAELLGKTEEVGLCQGRAISTPIELGNERFGSIVVHFAGKVGPEAQLALEMLTLQVRSGLESARRVAQEAERALLHKELDAARRRLTHSAARLHELAASREAERTQIATALREDIGQMLAAVLLGLTAFEQQLAGDPGSGSLGAARARIGETIRALRALAASLRPAALALGLRPALEDLAGVPERPLAVTVGELGSLGAETEVMLLRLAREALEAAGPARSLAVALTPDQSAVEMRLESAKLSDDRARLAALEADLELLGGQLRAQPGELRLELPLSRPTLSAPPQS
jgi:signal transduction histidine kinase